VGQRTRTAVVCRRMHLFDLKQLIEFESDAAVNAVRNAKVQHEQKSTFYACTERIEFSEEQAEVPESS